MNRRDLLKRAALGATILVVCPTSAWAEPMIASGAVENLAALETRHGGRLGVAILGFR